MWWWECHSTSFTFDRGNNRAHSVTVCECQSMKTTFGQFQNEPGHTYFICSKTFRAIDIARIDTATDDYKRSSKPQTEHEKHTQNNSVNVNSIPSRARRHKMEGWKTNDHYYNRTFRCPLFNVRISIVWLLILLRCSALRYINLFGCGRNKAKCCPSHMPIAWLSFVVDKLHAMTVLRKAIPFDLRWLWDGATRNRDRTVRRLNTSDSMIIAG